MAIEVITPEASYMRDNLELPSAPDRSFDTLCNNPGRTLTYLLAARNPGSPYTPAAFFNQLKGLQEGTEIGWDPGRTSASVTREYCNEFLVPTGLLKKIIIKGVADSPVTAYRADPKNLQSRIAIAATTLDWELQFPHLKLADLLGETRLDIEKTTPLKRLKIYEAFLDTSIHPASAFKLSRHIGKSPNATNGAIRRLLSCGILTQRSEPKVQNLTYLQIREDLQPPIEDLLLRYRNLQTNPTFVEAAVKRADEILSDPAAIAFLMRKAKPNSDAESLPQHWAKDPDAVLRARLGSLTLQRLPIEPRWENRALCKAIVDRADEMDDKIAAAEIFFPPGTEGPSEKQIEAAKKICRACPVAASCLQWALDTGQQEGVFGGMTPEDRRKYRNQKPRVDALQANPTRPRTNAEISELLEEVAIQKRIVLSRPAKDLQKQG